MIKISIIVPMYNVEKYIEKCILSCVNQNIPSNQYEILIINDGSPDGSLEIAEKLARIYTNIRIITQENQGLSGARNTGIQNSKGKYIWFVDSDDYIKENCLNAIYEQCENQQLELLAICVANVEGDSIKRRNNYVDINVLKGIDVLNNGLMVRCAPFTIYRRDFLIKHKLTFYPSIYHEDSEFTPRSYYYARKVGFTNEILYYYVLDNPYSIMHTINPKRVFDRLKVIYSINNFLETVVDKKDYLFYHNYISMLLNNALSLFVYKKNCNYNLKQVEKQFCKEMYLNRHVFSHLRKSSILKYKIEGILFTIFPFWSLQVYKFIRLFDLRRL